MTCTLPALTFDDATALLGAAAGVFAAVWCVRLIIKMIKS